MSTKKTKKPFNYWMIATFALLLIFGGFITYDKSPTVHNAVNGVLGIEDNMYPVILQVRVEVLVDKSLENPPYDYNEQLTGIEEEFEMDLVVTEIDFNDEKGQKYIEDFELNSIPVLLFEEDLEDTAFYEEAKDFFSHENDKYMLVLMPYKYLKLPDANNGHVKGATNPKVTIIEYSSFSCGYCGKMKPILAQLIEEYPNDVQLVYKQFNRGGVDPILENASECAGEQDKFWEFHDYIFDNQAEIQVEHPGDFVTAGADAIGLDRTSFDECIDGGKYMQKVEENTAEAFKFGVNGTPSFFINDEFVGGAVSYESMKEIIDKFI
ncbi:DsbA family protein [Patescibacteria group bacterium]